MALFDEEPKQAPRVHQIGQDLSMLSLGELEQRISQLRGEIERLEAEMKAKGVSKAAAEALFRI